MPITSRLRLPAPTVFNIVFRFYPSYVKSQNMTYKHAITLQIKFSHTGTLANFFKSENDFFYKYSRNRSRRTSSAPAKQGRLRLHNDGIHNA